jgi:pimeloyl-ACP methyl ester carboxylesterase
MMQKFNSAGVEIAYSDEGDGQLVLLIHGFASNGRVNWQATGWTKTLLQAGYRVVCIDNRGHGESEKLYDPASYSASLMAHDAGRLLDRLGIAKAAVMGYSMGARVAAFLTLQQPAKVSRVVFAGLAERMVLGVPGAEAISEGLLAENARDVKDPGARSFRIFAENTKSDLKALSACMRSSRVKIKPETLAAIQCPVLVVAGELDDVAGAVAPLVNMIPGARGLVLPKRNHMNAVGDVSYKTAVLAFLKELNSTGGTDISGPPPHMS